jgi:hypothetical protein
MSLRGAQLLFYCNYSYTLVWFITDQEMTNLTSLPSQSKEECEYLISLAKPHMKKSTVVDASTGGSKDSRFGYRRLFS